MLRVKNCRWNIFANDWKFAKFAKLKTRENLAIYGIKPRLNILIVPSMLTYIIYILLFYSFVFFHQLFTATPGHFCSWIALLRELLLTDERRYLDAARGTWTIIGRIEKHQNRKRYLLQHAKLAVRTLHSERALSLVFCSYSLRRATKTTADVARNNIIVS